MTSLCALSSWCPLWLILLLFQVIFTWLISWVHLKPHELLHYFGGLLFVKVLCCKSKDSRFIRPPYVGPVSAFETRGDRGMHWPLWLLHWCRIHPRCSIFSCGLNGQVLDPASTCTISVWTCPPGGGLQKCTMGNEFIDQSVPECNARLIAAAAAGRLHLPGCYFVDFMSGLTCG